MGTFWASYYSLASSLKPSSPLNLLLLMLYPSQGTPVGITSSLQMALLVSNHFKTMFLWNPQLAPTNMHVCPSEFWKAGPSGDGYFLSMAPGYVHSAFGLPTYSRLQT